jgi:methanogenic corrinoid protein MtbC1
MFILRPRLAETGAPKIGKMIIGTVKGDIHTSASTWSP